MRNKADQNTQSRIKRAPMSHATTLLLSVSLLLAGPSLAAESDGGGNTPATTEKSPPVKSAQGAQRSARKPAGTFKPTEKIRADSAVSFPVDI